MWSPDTRARERPRREVEWKTPLLNGDIQVIFEPDDMNVPLSALYHLVNQPLPFSYYQKRWTDPRLSHPQNYYLAMWDEGAWAPMKQVRYDFDVRRSIDGFERIEDEEENTDPLCGLWRKEGIDQQPLFQRAYAATFLSYERWKQANDGLTTREWMRGDRAAQDDQWFKDGYVNTGYKGGSCMESIEKVKWLL